MNKLILYFIPSPRPVDWSSPRHLARSIVRNQIIRKKRFIGHVNIELEGEFLTGIAAKDIDISRSLLLKQKLGLGILYHSFVGKQELEGELRAEINSYLNIGNSRINFIEFIINEQQAQRVRQYYKTLCEKQLFHNYGLVHNPLYAEGSGCSALGASFLEILGASEQFKKVWSRTISIPNKYTKNKSFLSFLIKKSSWNDGADDSKQLFFWDPDLMYKWVEAHKNTNVKRQNVTGLKLDICDTPLPDKIFHIQQVSAKDPDIELQSNIR